MIPWHFQNSLKSLNRISKSVAGSLATIVRTLPFADISVHRSILRTQLLLLATE